MEILFFYKNESGEKIPTSVINTHGYGILIDELEGEYFFKQKQKDHPEIKDNLFAFVEGEIFKVPYV